MFRGFKDKPLEWQHGTILASAHCFSQKMLQDSTFKSREFDDATLRITDQLKESSHNLLLSAACLALGELGRCGALPVKNEGSKDSLDNKVGIVQRLLTIMKTGKLPMKIRERSALALGQLCVRDLEFPCRQDVLSGFLESARVRATSCHHQISVSLSLIG